MIRKEGDIIELKAAVKVLKAFALEDQIYYVVKPMNMFSESLWIIAGDGSPLKITTEILEKASLAVAHILDDESDS